MKKILVAYFSATGTTAAAAKALAKAASADLYEISPAEPYTANDLDWTNRYSRSTMEMNNSHSRPALASQTASPVKYDILFLGYPIWWCKAPTLINTFLEKYDFSGKTIILFATSGGSSLEGSLPALQASAPGARMISGHLLNGSPSEKFLKSWISKLKL